MEDDVLNDDSRSNVFQVCDDQDLSELQHTECTSKQSTPKKVEKRPRETEDSSEDGFTTVSRRKPKRLIRSDSYERDRLFNENNENYNIYYEVSLFGLQILPKQMAFARLLRDENILNVTKIKYKSPYKIFVQFSDKKQAENLINSKKLIEMDIRAQFTNEGNLSYGIIKGVDLDTTEKELLETLDCDYDIISAKRLKRMSNEGKWVESETVRLCFRNPVMPVSINAYGFRFDVERFEFPVTRCSGCWSYGHVKKFCKLNRNICPKCGEAHENCEVTEFKCVNCKGPHMALDKSCPFFIKEKEIRSIMSERNVTYKIALGIYLKNQEEEKANNEREEINIGLDASYIDRVPTNTKAKTYSSVLKTRAIIHGNEEKNYNSDNEIKSKSKDKKKKKVKKPNWTNNSESQDESMEESDLDTSEISCEKEKKRRYKRFDVWNMLNRIKDIVLSEESWCEKVMLVLKAVFEECKFFFFF